MKNEDYIEEIENLKQSVNDAEKNLENKLLLLVATQESYAASLKEKHPLSLLANSKLRCHHFMMDFLMNIARFIYRKSFR